MVLYRRPFLPQASFEGHNTVRKGKAHTRSLHGIGTIRIDDTGGLTIAQVRARLRRLRRQHRICLVVVDYLQLMVEEGAQSREQEVSRISRGLKAIAKELDVPVLALSQLSRASEIRAGKRPQLSDLRDSGSLEQDADVVLFLHHPHRAGYADANPNEIEVIIAKQRNGPTGEFPLHWEEKYTLFADLAPACRQEQEPGYESCHPNAN
ncbi:MAG: DnaB-like helicase C-terminal domain-containing protein [Candidatus Latescibacteria bacterium]|nr:DnaB-like helicase C-terminal domain-containing protein [Candidatus Latescibacterota bacterium]